MTPDDFTRAFAYAFGDRDSGALADLIAPFIDPRIKLK